jgi:hypothetical protein
MHWDDKAEKLTIADRRGSFPGMLEHRTFHIVIVRDGHGTGIASASEPDATISYVGKATSVLQSSGRLGRFRGAGSLCDARSSCTNRCTIASQNTPKRARTTLNNIIFHNDIRKIESFRNRQVSGSSPLVGSSFSAFIHAGFTGCAVLAAGFCCLPLVGQVCCAALLFQTAAWPPPPAFAAAITT